ncbi:MAG: hypothetical protein AABZ47_04030 [Planctomycetota bacterium]
MIHQQLIFLSVEGIHGNEELTHAAGHSIERGYDGIEFEIEADSATKTPFGPEKFACIAAVNCPSIILEDATRVVSDLIHRAGEYCASFLTLRLPPLREFRRETKTREENAHANRLSKWSARTNGIVGTPTRMERGGLAEFEHYADALNFADGLLSGVRFEAEQVGIPVAIMAGAGGCLFSPVEVRELLDRTHTWAVGVCLDQDLLTGMGRVDDWLDALGHRVLCVRLSGGKALEEATALNVKGYRGPIVVDGEVDAKRLRSALQETGSGIY